MGVRGGWARRSGKGQPGFPGFPSDGSGAVGIVGPAGDVFGASGVTGMFESFRIFNKTTAGFRGFAFPALARPRELLSGRGLPTQ